MPDTSAGLVAYYAFVAKDPLLDMAHTLGYLSASGDPAYVADCPGPPRFQSWGDSLCAQLASDSDSSGGGQYFRLSPVNLGAYSASQGFSICTWFVFDGTTSYGRIFDLGNGADNNNVVLARDWITDSLVLGFFGEGTASRLYSPVPIVNGQWRHVCVVNKGMHWSIYDNGALTASETATFSLNDVLLTSNFIGRSNWGDDRLLVGRVDEFKIYQRRLTSTEVAMIYSGSCPACPAGTWSNTRGASVCELCQPGTFSNGPDKPCAPCPAGSWLSDASSCSRCPAGSWSTMSSASVCTTCSAGSYYRDGLSESGVSLTHS